MLVDVDHSMKVMRDETFGPVVGVMKVRDDEEAMRLANDTRYGLSGSVFGSRERAERVARRVECGAVNVNDVLVNYFASDVPMGGWKESGIGYRHGAEGIRKFCRTESLVITRFGGKREPTWYPYTRARRGLVGRLSQAAQREIGAAAWASSADLPSCSLCRDTGHKEQLHAVGSL